MERPSQVRRLGFTLCLWTPPLGLPLISPTTNLLRFSTVIDCGKGGDIGLPGDGAAGCGETDGFRAISVLVMEQHRRMKIFQRVVRLFDKDDM